MFPPLYMSYTGTLLKTQDIPRHYKPFLMILTNINNIGDLDVTIQYLWDGFTDEYTFPVLTSFSANDLIDQAITQSLSTFGKDYYRVYTGSLFYVEDAIRQIGDADVTTTVAFQPVIEFLYLSVLIHKKLIPYYPGSPIESEMSNLKHFIFYQYLKSDLGTRPFFRYKTLPRLVIKHVEEKLDREIPSSLFLEADHFCSLDILNNLNFYEFLLEPSTLPKELYP